MEPAALCALAQGLQAAANELTGRLHATPCRVLTLGGDGARSLSLAPVTDGLLLLEHPGDWTPQAIRQYAANLAGTMNRPQPAAPRLSLADALNAPAP